MQLIDWRVVLLVQVLVVKRHKWHFHVSYKIILSIHDQKQKHQQQVDEHDSMKNNVEEKLFDDRLND